MGHDRTPTPKNRSSLQASRNPAGTGGHRFCRPYKWDRNTLRRGSGADRYTLSGGTGTATHARSNAGNPRKKTEGLFGELLAVPLAGKDRGEFLEGRHSSAFPSAGTDRGEYFFG